MVRGKADPGLQVVDAVRLSGVVREGQSLLVAVSGGQDSVALLLALSELRAEWRLSLTVGHVNHGLRGAESDEDEAFVRRLAGELGLPVLIRRVTVEAGGGSFEAAARDARLGALREMASSVAADRIALGHTADDRAETVLMNILRGSGLEGLAAMPAETDDLLRPILRMSRQQTAAFCAARGVTPRQDSSNLDLSLLRNRVRLALLPLLESEYQPRARQALVRLAEIAEGELAWTRPLVQEALRAATLPGCQAGGALRVSALKGMPEALRRRVLREAIGSVRGHVREITQEHLDSLDVLVLGGHTGARRELPECWVERTAESVVFRPGRPVRAAPFERVLPVPGEVDLPEAGLKVTCRVLPAAEVNVAGGDPWTAHVDARCVGEQLTVRRRQPGDRLTPLGMQGRKKLQDFLVDKKIPRAEREGMVVVVTAAGEIVWLIGQRISERAKVTRDTRQVAVLVARPTD